MYTIDFNQRSLGEGKAVVIIDSTNAVTESSETNNVATILVDGDNRDDGYGYDPSDDADFKILDLEVGRISGNRFIEDDEADEGDDVAIRFVVANIGGEETEDWRFEIDNLPYDDDDTYRSGRQDSLRPGESVEVITEFENADEGNYRIRVEVDSEDDTDEENERNNDDSVRLEVE